MSLSFILKFFHSQFFVTPPIPSHDWSGRTVVVTGANSGIGLEITRHLAHLKASKVIMACRNVSKAETAKAEILQSTGCAPESLEIWSLDMCSYESVRAFAARALKELPRIDALIENAGISESRQFSLAEDNEMTITINVISTFLLALLLLPRLKDTASKPLPGSAVSRTSITIVTSELSHMAKFPERNSAGPGQILDTLNNASKSNMSDRYMVSKLFQVYGIREIASALGSNSVTPVVVNATNPGFNDTEMVRNAWHRTFGFPDWFIDLLLPRIARKAKFGAASVLAGAEIGPTSHGEYLSDGVLAENPPLVLSADAATTQKAVWAEITAKLEKAAPGVMKNLD